MKKTLKNISLVLATTLLLGIASCGTNNNSTTSDDKTGGDTVVSSLPNYDAKKDELRVDITGWVAPANMNQEQIDNMLEVGLNTIFLASAGAYKFDTANPTKDNLELLDKFKANGIKPYISALGKDALSLEYIGQYKDNDAVAGMFFDEPNKKQIDDLAGMVDKYNTLSGGKPLYVNLYPSLAPCMKTEFKDYEDYLNYYCNNVLSKIDGEKYLSADRYPLTYNAKGEKVLDSGWLSDIEAVAVTSEKFGYKDNFFIQTMSYTSNGISTEGQLGSRDRVPTYEDIRLQEYTLMAFGYDSISMFCYGTPSAGNGEFIDRNVALIDRNGNKTQIYEDAKKANTEILSFDHVIKQFERKGVFTSDKNVLTQGRMRTSNSSFSNLSYRMSLDEVGGITSVKATADTLYGYFVDKDDNEGFMIVNYNDTSLKLNDTVTLNFEPSYNYTKVRVYKEGKIVEVDVKDNSVTLELGIGEGVFVIPY